MSLSLLLLISTLAAGQLRTAAPPHALEEDAEATKVLSAAQQQMQNLLGPKKQQILNGFSGILLSKVSKIAPSTIDPNHPETVLQADPGKLSLEQKNQLLSLIQQTQQVVDPTLVPSSTTSLDPKDILSVFGSPTPLTPDEIKLYSNNLKQLPVLAASIGRLLWADKTDQKWTLEGTVFVTKTNVVATACHVIEPLVDVSNGKISLRGDRMAVIDFSEGVLPTTGQLPPGIHTYSVLDIIATGSGRGCDVALLKLSGAEAVPLLRVSDGKTLPKRLVVIGYPQLSDLTDLVCQYSLDSTTKYFCQFRAAHPGIAKVKSPGSTYASNSHDGIDVFTYNASTRGGQSGSPVIDLDSLRVVGVHYCCTGSSQVDTTLGCATWHAQNLKWNEAISTKTIIGDEALKNFFEVDSTTLAKVNPASQSFTDIEGATTAPAAQPARVTGVSRR
jgi:hypothetical protein